VQETYAGGGLYWLLSTSVLKRDSFKH